MEVFKKIGSKERFFEIMQGVNKVKLNEQIGEHPEFVVKAFNDLVSGEMKIEQITNQVNGNTSIVEITGVDDNGSRSNFTFEVQSNEADQQGVNIINDAKLIKFSSEFPDGGGINADENSKEVAEINAGRKQEMIDAISEYVEFENDSDTVADEMYEEAIRLIDKVPYNKGSEEIQTQKAYADQKPVNPDVRVDAEELQKFVSEIQDYVPDEEQEEDPMALPPDYSEEDLPKPADADDGSISTDPYEQEPEYGDEEASPEEQQLYSQAYDNLMAAGNRAPTGDQIEREVQKIQGLDKPVEKTRAIPRGAEEFWEGNTMDDISADTVVKQGFNELLPEEKKKQYIFQAQEIVDEALGNYKSKLSREEYVKNVWREAVKLYKEKMAGVEGETIGVNEEEKTDYPDPIGKKFKPKSQMPKKKRKPQSVVNIKEDDVPEIDIEDVTTAKEATGDQLEGGLGDDKLPNQFDPEQVAMGVKVEMEHTDNPLLAVEIALDHLTEIPDYYTRLDKMEKKAGVEHHDDEESSDEELTDELLGYKPHNVSDYANEEFDVPASPEQERDYWDKEYYRQDQEIEEPQGIDWQEFYTMSKDTSGYNPEYEQKYGNQLNKPHIVDALENSEDFKSFMRRIKDFEDINEYVDMGMEEYQGEVGDRYRDSEGNEFAVSDITKGGVVLRGYGGSKEVGTGELKHMEKLNEDVDLARAVLKNRRLDEGMTKQDAVRLLVRHNIK